MYDGAFERAYSFVSQTRRTGVTGKENGNDALEEHHCSAGGG
jgi:hypothetical protein